MTEEEWGSHFVRCFGMLISNETTLTHDSKMKPLHEETYLMLFNAHHEPMDFVLPEGVKWDWILNTAIGFIEEPQTMSGGGRIQLIDRSLCLFKKKVSFISREICHF